MEVQKSKRTRTLNLRTIARDYMIAIVLAAVAALLVRDFIIEAFKIPTDFMSPTLMPGDHIFVSKLSYRRYGLVGPRIEPKRGDVVIFSFPNDPKKDFIKRVIAIEGDTVEIQDSVVFVNGKAISVPDVDAGYMTEEVGGKRFRVKWDSASKDAHKMTSARVPDNQVFVLGDNRSKGQDSRNWGFFQSNYIKGRATMIWFSAGSEGVRWNRLFKGIE